MGAKNPATIEFNQEEKEIQKKAREAYDRGNISEAYNLYFSLYSQNGNPRGLQLNIGLCLLKMNRKRQARLFAFKELLDYPDNELALRLLSEQSNKITGKTIAQKFYNDTWPDHFPDITLSMIVKNEEKTLAKCLESFKDIVKEIIIVDTGSTDRTVEIAKSYGARVEYFEWTNDFAEARNESLKYATCEWILRTDADEWIEDSEKPKLLHCVNSGLADVYLCPTISKLANGEQRVENVRLIKNHLGVEFNYPIHETVAISVNKLGLTQCLTNVEFQHSGYEFLEEGSGQRKTERNINVCKNYLIKHPDDFYVREIYGLFLLNSTRKDEAVENIEQALKIMPDDASPVKYTGLAYIALSQIYISQKRDIDLLNLLLDAQIDFHIYSCMMQFVGQVYLYNRGDWKKANKIFDWILQRYAYKLTFTDILPVENFNEEQCTLLMADTCVLMKDYEKARKYYLKAKKLKSLKSSTGEVTDKSTEAGKNFQDVDLLSAEELRVFAKTPKENLKWIDTYRNILRAASKSQLTAQDYLDLANCQIQLNDLYFAQLLIDEARQINPNLPMGTNLESLIALKEGNTQKGLEKAIEAFVMEPANEKYQQNVEQVSALLKMSPVESIRKTGLGWITSGKIHIGLFALMLYLKFKPDDEEIKAFLAKYLN